MKKSVILAATALVGLLAGCGGESADGSKTASQSSLKREAGNWVSEPELVKLEMPGMPAEAQEAMRNLLATQKGENYCLTDAEAAKDDFEKLLAEGPGDGGECTWTKKDINGKNIDVAGSCVQQGQKAELAMVGTMEPTQSDMTITTKAVAPNGQPMEMVMRVKAKRTGACTPTQAAQADGAI